MGPVVVELFVHERAVTIIGEVFANGIEGILQEVGVFLLLGCKIKVD